MDGILIIMKKNNGHQGIICPFTGAFFRNMQTCLLVYTYNRSQVSVYRTIGPLVFSYHPHDQLKYCAKQCKMFAKRGGEFNKFFFQMYCSIT